MARAKGAVYYPKTLISVYQGMYDRWRLFCCDQQQQQQKRKSPWFKLSVVVVMYLLLSHSFFSPTTTTTAAQNIANSHFLVPCNFMPETVQMELALQRPKRDASLAGTYYVLRDAQRDPPFLFSS
jgi:hypothetical protein